MKTKTKALVLAVCAVLLVVTTMVATMAFLTSQDQVTNTFTVGNVSITLDEIDVAPNGSAASGASRVESNEYHLIPGHTYTKDPTIHVDANSEDCWLFVKVENGIVDIEDSEDTIASQMAVLGWSLVNGSENVYAYQNTVSKGSDVKVFDHFQVSGDAATSGYATAQIVVTAYAIQADGFETALDAIAAAPFPTDASAVESV